MKSLGFQPISAKLKHVCQMKLMFQTLTTGGVYLCIQPDVWQLSLMKLTGGGLPV